MTFEDMLCGFLINPDEKHELIYVTSDLRLEYMNLLR